MTPFGQKVVPSLNDSNNEEEEETWEEQRKVRAARLFTYPMGLT